MGGNASTEKPAAAVDRGGLTEVEYTSLRTALRVEDEEAARANVDINDFLARFPPRLRPLVLPLFSLVANVGAGETSASWPVVVRGIARVVNRGSTWQDLLDAWGRASGAAAPSGEDASVLVELVASLCFWATAPATAPGLPAEGEPAAAEGEETTAPAEAQGEEYHMDAELEAFLRALLSAASGAAGDGDALSADAAAALLDRLVPQLPCAVAPCLAHALLGARCPRPRLAEPAPPAMAESRILRPRLALLLRAMNATLWDAGIWQPLYRDWKDGRSFNALVKGALHYSGPAVVLVRLHDGEVFGALSSSWEDGHGKFSGNPETFLFALEPTPCVCKSEGASGNFAYLNARNKHAPRGLGFGGQVGFCRLWLDADFEECHVLGSDATFGDGSLFPGAGERFQSAFQPTLIEIWGCGGEEAAVAQFEQRQRDEGVRDQARKVDRAKLLENDFDKEMFFGKTFAAAADAREDVEQLKEDEGN